MARKTIDRIVSSMMVIVLVLGLMPLPAYAEPGGDSSSSLQVGTIQSGQLGAQDDSATSSDPFGKYWSEANQRYELSSGVFQLTADFTAKGPIVIKNDFFNRLIPATIDLNGHTLKREVSSVSDTGCIIENNGKLVVKSSADSSGTITGGKANYGGGIYLQLGKINMYKGSVSGDTATEGGGVRIAGNGTFATVQVDISKNRTKKSSGGGIYNGKGTLDMTRCTVNGNSAINDGGGICTSGKAMLDDVTLGQNTALDNGGAVIAAGGSIEITSACPGIVAVSASTVSSYWQVAP